MVTERKIIECIRIEEYKTDKIKKTIRLADHVLVIAGSNKKLIEIIVDRTDLVRILE